MERTSKFTLFMMLVCGLLTIAAGIAWINNISIARQWRSDIMHNKSISKAISNTEAKEKLIDNRSDVELKGKLVELKGKLIDLGGKVYSGPIEFLNGPARVDYSTMTTLIPFVGLFFLTIGFGRIAWKSDRERMRKEHFPFFRFYNGITVTLGLIGTIWGLIMIGYYHDPDVDDLTACLHTALFSTLVALVWVYLIALPLRYTMQWWDKRLYNVADPDDVDGAFENLVAAASGLGKTLTDAGNTAGGFTEKMGQIQEQITGIVGKLNSAAGSIDTAFARIGSILTQHVQLMEEQRAANAKQQQVLDNFLKSLELMQQRNQELGDELKEQSQARKTAEDKLETIIKALRP